MCAGNLHPIYDMFFTLQVEVASAQLSSRQRAPAQNISEAGVAEQSARALPEGKPGPQAAVDVSPAAPPSSPGTSSSVQYVLHGSVSNMQCGLCLPKCHDVNLQVMRDIPFCCSAVMQVGGMLGAAGREGKG
jgi:hypothetical protein